MRLSGDLIHLFRLQENDPDYDPNAYPRLEQSRCIEIESDLTARTASIEVKTVDENSLDTWLDEAVKFKNDLFVIFLTILRKTRRSSPNAGEPKGRGDPDVRKVHLRVIPVHDHDENLSPFTNDAFRSAVGLIRFPIKERHLMFRSGPTRFFEVPMENGGTGLVIRMEAYNERDIHTFSMIAANANCSRTCAILRVLEIRTSDLLLQRIEELRQHLWHPCVLASIQVEARLPKVEWKLRSHKNNIERIEKTAGIYKVYSEEERARVKEGLLKPWNTEGLDLLRNELASVKNDALYQRYKCARFLDLLDFLDALADRLDDMPEYRVKSKFLRSAIVGYEGRAKYLSDRADTTIQTCFSIMSQKDNYLNQQPASQSLKLTDLAREDNKRMSQIALATYRHSSDMRAVTIITLSFLPATFVATFFSTSFFNFHVDKRTASTWLWVYWVVTICLTAAVMGGWRCFLYGSKATPIVANSVQEPELENGTLSKSVV